MTATTAHEYLICREGRHAVGGNDVFEALQAVEDDDGTLQAIYCHLNGTIWSVDFEHHGDGLEIEVMGARFDDDAGEPELLEYLLWEATHTCGDPESCDGDCPDGEPELTHHDVHIGH